MNKKIKTLILHIEGGIGKNIAATAFTASFKKEYPNVNIIVVCAWDEVWIGNTDIKRVYNFRDTKYFYENFVKDKQDETLIIRQDPYHQSSYILREKGLIDSWAEMADIKITCDPVINISTRELDFTRNQLELDDREIFMIHPSGGADMQGMLPYSWARDIPPLIAQKIIDKMNNAGYRVIQLGRQNQRLYNGAQLYSSTIRSTIAALTFSKKRLLIDSFPQHAAKALNLDSTVLWIANTPNMLGYKSHTNFVCDKPMREDATRGSYLEPFNILGDLEEFPYDTNDLFDIDKIMVSLLNEKAEETKVVESKKVKLKKV